MGTVGSASYPGRAEMASIIQPIKDMAAVATVNHRAMVKFL